MLPALAGGAINVISAPPIGAEQLQWSSRVTHMNTETLFYAIGGFIASSARIQSLPPKLREVIQRRGAESSERLTKTIRSIDAQAFARMKQSKHTYELTDSERAEWKAVFIKVARELRGSVFTPSMFDHVMQLAGNPLDH